jgi:hypothetical protein
VETALWKSTTWLGMDGEWEYNRLKKGIIVEEEEEEEEERNLKDENDDDI